MSEHRHWLTFHRHPNWHGHCRRVLHMIGAFEWLEPKHSCHRWHFHLPFTHKHTGTAR